eukprot:scaffold5504_cov47-Attheya_sp.AAC.1
MRNAAAAIFFVIIVGTFIFLASPTSPPPRLPPGDVTGFEALRIAHAGGGINGTTYTNSYQALNVNMEKGFLYFELDFIFTSDDKLVCLHDWGNKFEQLFGFKTSEKLTLKEFEQLVNDRSKFTLCTLDGLAVWMKENPSAYIVSDVKENNVKALSLIYRTLPDAHKRVIPQIYQPQNFDVVKRMGFDQIIWTLYHFDGSTESVLFWITMFQGPVAITMPTSRAESTLPADLKIMNVSSYTHTINDAQEAERFITKFGIIEIYRFLITVKNVMEYGRMHSALSYFSEINNYSRTDVLNLELSEIETCLEYDR